MRRICVLFAVVLGLVAIPASASALSFELAPGMPLVPETSELDPSPVMPPGFAPTDIAAGDFNKDGFDDFAVVTDYIFIGEEGGSVSPISTNIYLYLGSEDGSFESSVSNPIGANSEVTGRFMIRAIDVDGDGDLDLVSAGSGSPTKIETYENTLVGNNEAFGTVPSATLDLDGSQSAAGYRSTSLGDKDGDGDVDIVLGLYNNRYVFIRNRGVGGSLDIPTGSVQVSSSSPQDFDGIISTAIGNFGGDNSGDLVMISNPQFSSADPQPDRLLYAPSTSDTGFAASPQVLLELGANQYFGWVEAIDLNGDQYDDLIFKVQTFGEDIIRTALGGPDGPVLQDGDGKSVEVYGAQPGAMADLNDDGNQDIAIPEFVDAGFAVGLSDGSGNLELDAAGPFALPKIGAVNFYPQASVTLDANGDGRPDFAAVSGHSGSLSQGRGVAVMLNNASPGISVNPTSIDFGQVPFEAELIAPVPVTIKSNGDLPLDLGDISFNGPAISGFQLDRGNCPNGQLAPGASCTVEVSMSQSVSGSFNGYLGITSNATTDPIQIEVIGQVRQPEKTSEDLSLTVKSAKKVKSGKKLLVTALVKNSGTQRSAHFDLRATAPKKLTGKIKFATIRNLSISENHTSKFQFKVPVKRKAKGKFQVKVSLIAESRTLVAKTSKVKIQKKKSKRKR